MNDYTVWDQATGKIKRSGNATDPETQARDGESVYVGVALDDTKWKFNTATGEPVEEAPDIPQDELAVMVNRERQRRIEAGKDFGGVWLTGLDRDQTILMGLGRKAEKLKAAGINEPVLPFRDGLNVIHMLTPDQMLELEDVGAQYVTACYQAAWALKDAGTIPQDVTNDVHWP